MSWTCPSAAELMQVVNATWPAAQQIPCGPFMLRDGQQGGKRASSASLEAADFTVDDIKHAEQEMFGLNQPSLFMIRKGDKQLDGALADQGYHDFDYVTLFAAPSAALAEIEQTPLAALPCPEPLAAMAEIWAEAGISEHRIDVMRRCGDPKTYLLGRVDNAPSGAAFVAIHNSIAMIHALEVLQASRRKGLGLQMMATAAAWAVQQNAETFALVVLTSNTAACALYKRLGMVEAGNYHYRIKEKS